MGFTSLAIVVGVVLGLVTGGRPSRVAAVNLNWWPALAAGVTLQWAPELIGLSERASFVLVVASYTCLMAFAIANIRMVGMAVVLVGLTLNVIVISVNGGMPVRASAIRAAGLEESNRDLSTLDFGSKRHLEEPDDRLTFLGDVVPVRAVGEVLSFGDLILCFGVADLVFRLLKPPAMRRRQGEIPADLVLAERGIDCGPDQDGVDGTTASARHVGVTTPE